MALSGDTYGLSGGGSGDDTSSAWGTSYGSHGSGTQRRSQWRTPGFAPPVSGNPSNGIGGDTSTPYSPSYGGANANGANGGTDPVAQDRQARQTFQSLKSAGHDVKWQGNQLIVDGRPYELGNGSGSGSGASSGSGSAMPDGIDPRLASLYQKYGATPTGAGTGLTDWSYWQNDAVKNANGDWNYVLGRLGDDLGGNGMDTGPNRAPNTPDAKYSFNEPDAPWGADGPAVYNPGTIGFDDIPNFTPESLQAQMNNPESAKALESLITGLEQHPESLDPHTVDTMKANMKDTLAEQNQFADADLKGMGASYGIGDSPWLASERAGQQRSTNQAIAKGAQDLDVTAATTNAADKRSAAQIGTTFQGMRGQQLMDTVNAGLQRATVTGNRLALRESVAQAAAASRQSSQKIMADWIQTNIGHQIDIDKLNEQGAEFTEDLMMKVQQLNQQDRQFGAQYGLDTAKLQEQTDQDQWNRSYLDNKDLSGTSV